jgi:hypothetical protein
MALNPAQTATVKAYILADPVLGPLTSGTGTDYGAIALALSATAAPATLAWKPSVPAADSDDAPDMSTFDALTAGKRDSWALFLGQTTRDFTRNKVRKWITDVWGNATAASNAESVLLAGTENAKRVEVVLGGTTRTTGTVSALARNYVGDVSLPEIAAMFNVNRVGG